MGLTESLLLIAAILFVADVFLDTDILSLVAYGAISVAVASLIDAHILYRLLVGLVAFLAIGVIHYTVWKRHVVSLIHSRLAPDRYRAGPAGLVGRTGVVRQVEGEDLVDVDGELHPFEATGVMEVGATVTVDSAHGGVLRVSKAG